MSLKIFVYENSSISFKDGDSLMVNATEMAKAFGKRPAEWLRLPSTDAFLSAYEAMGKSHRSELIKAENGVATWFHENIALEFARWLSPSFSIWCNDRIRELLTHGITASTAKIEEMLSNPDTMIATLTALKQERAGRELAEGQLKLANKTIQEQAPIVQYAQQVLQAPDLIATNVIAADLGVSAVKLNKLLRENRIIYSQSGVNVLYSAYRDKGLADYKTHTYLDKAGTSHAVQHLYWTETGRRFIVERFAIK